LATRKHDNEDQLPGPARRSTTVRPLAEDEWSKFDVLSPVIRRVEKRRIWKDRLTRLI